MRHICKVPRTPLFALIRRTLATADTVEHSGRSLDELAERRASRVSRRAWLAGSGAALGVGLFGCQPPAPPAAPLPSDRSSSPGVVIVGAGLAGLTAAYRLAQAGIASRVFDANDRIGGRTFTLHHADFPSKVELGGEFIDSGHTAIRRLASELGLSLIDVASAAADREPERYYIGEQRYTEVEMIELFRPVAALLRRDLALLGDTPPTSHESFTPPARELDRLSLSAWLDRGGIRGPVRSLLDSAYTGEYGLEPDEQSCLNLLYLIGTEAPPLHLFGDSDEQFTVREGNAALAARLASRSPLPVELNHALVALRPRSDGRLLLTFARDQSVRELVVDRLVLALPFNQLRKVELAAPLSAAKQRALAGLRYGTNAKLMVATSSRPWLASGSSGTSFNDAVYHQSWDSARGYPGAGGVITSFCGGRLGLALGQGTPEQQAVHFLERLEHVYPGVERAHAGPALRFHWPSAPFFEGSYACYGPGDYASFAGSEGGAEANLHFCGEHTSRAAQGYMEGAVESGERVAAEIRAALGRRKAA
jgi:monoamine oxidase